MSFSFKITRPRARLEAELASSSSFSRMFSLIGHESSLSNARWWDRTVLATDDQWLRLQGRHRTNPADTWKMIFEDRARPALPLPVLALADFVAHSETLADPELRWLFNWVAWALDDLLYIAPAPLPQASGLIVPSETLDVAVQTMIDVLMKEQSPIPWPDTDGAQLQTLAHLGQHLWSFPPDLVRQLVDTTVLIDEKDVPSILDMEDEHDIEAKKHRLSGPALLAQLSGWYCWRKGIPRVRGLTIRSSTLYFLLTLRQAVILSHPDAPSIDDADLGRLCDGMIGISSQRSFPKLFEDYEDISMASVSRASSHAHILKYSQEAMAGTYTPTGLWDIAPTPRFPLFETLDLRVIRLISTPEGFWVRLLPQDGAWGCVLWWTPQIEPSVPLAFALGTTRDHGLVWSLHEALWTLWRDLRIDGAPRTI